MRFTVRPARREDARQMLQVYNNFTKQFVGSALRTSKSFQRMLRRKDNISWVALDNRNQIIGYVSARLEKRINRGEFREIVVDPKHDFERVAKPLAKKINSAFIEKKVTAIQAGSLRNPWYDKLFPTLGFFESESTGVFMYSILDVRKFLNEISQVFINRLKHIESWNGLAQIECDGLSLLLQKTSEEAKQIVWTNQPIDFRVKLNAALLTKLIFGIVDPVESLKNGKLEVEATTHKTPATEILKQLFPQTQFLIMDYW